MQFFIADVRKRANTDSNMTPQAVPEPRDFADAADADPAPAEAKNYQSWLATFSRFAPETPDDAVACPLPQCEGVTLEWTAGPSEGQIDFYAPAPDAEEPARFLTLYTLSGIHPNEDRRVLKRLESYADFSQCLQYPLVLRVVDDPLTDASHHQLLQALRDAITPLVAAFLKTYFNEPTPAAV